MNILVIRLSALGDILRTLPALRGLRRAFPDAHITWLAQDMAHDLLGGHPQVDEWLHFPRREWKDTTVLRKFLLKLREREYDLVLDFHGRFKSAAMLVAARGHRKIGLAPPASREGAVFFCREVVKCPSPNRIEQSFAILRHLGITPDVSWELPVPAKAREWAEEAVRLHKDKRVLFFFPGTSRSGHYGETKQWSVENWGTLGKTLLNAISGATVMVGHGPGEEILARAVTESIGGGAVLAPATTLSRLAALISRSALYVGGDTGPTHLAWLLKTPTVAIFTVTSPEVNAAPEEVAWYRAVRVSATGDEVTRRAAESAISLLKPAP